jgi:hypothetical protein
MGFVLLGLSGLAQSAETKSLKAFIPWDGEGRVFAISPDTMLFLGSLEGIIYVEKAEGEMDEGFVRCPVSQKIELQTQATSGSGYCMITVSETETVYAEWTCKGKVGGCAGRFNVTGGTGALEGVTGSSEMIVRSPLRALVADMPSGSILRAASGIIILPELKYTLPSK